MPDASASRVNHASYASPVSRRTMLRIAALASSVVASIPIVCPSTRWASASRCNTHVNTAWVRLDVDQPARARQGRMVRRRLVAAQSPGTAGCSANRPRATRWPAPSPSLQNSRAAAIGNSAPAPDSAARCRRRSTARTVPRRRCRSRRRPGRDSTARRMDARHFSADPPWRPTYLPVGHASPSYPSPYLEYKNGDGFWLMI